MNIQQNSRQTIFAILCCVAMSGCDSATIVGEATSEQSSENLTDEGAAIFIATQSGGCVQIGPNCAEHSLFSDGRVSVTRNNSDTIEAEGTIDLGQVNSWLDLVTTIDFDSLKARLQQGICAGCLDGIDYEYTIQLDGDTTEFNSIMYNFDEAEPFFAMTNGMYEAMRNAAPLEIQSINN